MKKIILLLILLAGLTCMVQADDLVIKSGAVFKNYAIAGAAPGGIRVFHSGGVAIIPPDQFPDELKSKIAKFQKDIPAEKKKHEQRKKDYNKRKAAKKKLLKERAAKEKKSAEILKKEAAKEKQIQTKLRGKTKTSNIKFETTKNNDND